MVLAIKIIKYMHIMKRFFELHGQLLNYFNFKCFLLNILKIYSFVWLI